MPEPLILIASLRAKAGAEEELGRRLSALVDSALWVLYESWRSQEDLDQHFLMPYLASLLADFPGLLREEMQLHFMTKADANGRAA